MKNNLLKTLPFFVFLLLFTQNIYGVIEFKPVDNKITKVKNTDLSDRDLSIDEMLVLDNKAIEKKTEKKLKLKEKLALRIARKRIKKARKKGKSDAEIKSLLAEKGGSKPAAFILGFLLGLIGVLIVYLAMDRQFTPNAWIGFGTFLIIYLVLLLVVF